MANVKYLETPLKDDDIKNLHVGDIVYISGTLITARDLTHRVIIKLLEESKISKDIFEGCVIYHAGPVVKRENDKWHIVSIGPTTSIRMEKYIPRLLKLANVKMIVGKGGLTRRVVPIFRDRVCAYGIFPGGCGIVAAIHVKEVIDVMFLEELGIPEAMWILRVENFGPIVITVDCEGNILGE